MPCQNRKRWPTRFDWGKSISSFCQGTELSLPALSQDVIALSRADFVASRKRSAKKKPVDMQPNFEDRVGNLESAGGPRNPVSASSTDAAPPNDLLELCKDPGMARLMRACARLPAATCAALQEYLSGCFLESVTARIEPDGALRLDTVAGAGADQLPKQELCYSGALSPVLRMARSEGGSTATPEPGASTLESG